MVFVVAAAQDDDDPGRSVVVWSLSFFVTAYSSS